MALLCKLESQLSQFNSVSPSSSSPRILQKVAMNRVLPVQALCANTFAIAAATSFEEDKDDGTLSSPPNMVNNLVELLRSTSECVPLTLLNPISIIFITATLGQHLPWHYPRLKPPVVADNRVELFLCLFSLIKSTEIFTV